MSIDSETASEKGRHLLNLNLLSSLNMFFLVEHFQPKIQSSRWHPQECSTECIRAGTSLSHARSQDECLGNSATHGLSPVVVEGRKPMKGYERQYEKKRICLGDFTVP